MRQIKFQISNSQKGVTLIMTFFVMIIVLTVVLSVSVLLYGQIKVVRNMGNSVASYYAGESGIEKVLFYDRRVLPSHDENARGLCYMLDQSNTKYCTADPYPETSSEKDSIYCNNSSPSPQDLTSTCDPNSCTDCTIIFDTSFDGRTYKTTATIVPTSGNFLIDSGGSFGGASRKVNTTIIPNP